MKHFRMLVMMLSIVCAVTLYAKNGKPFRMIDINVWSGTDYQSVLKFGMWESPDTLELRYQVLLANLKTVKPDVWHETLIWTKSTRSALRE
jgi:hypothetical protein